MNIQIEYRNDNTVIATDKNQNSVFFIKKGNYLQPSFASFNGAIYDKADLDWKRSKRGAVSKAFYEWFEEFDKQVYELHYLK